MMRKRCFCGLTDTLRLLQIGTPSDLIQKASVGHHQLLKMLITFFPLGDVKGTLISRNKKAASIELD